MRALSHVFIRVHHEARDINLLLVTSEKGSGSEERIRAKINTELFRIRFDLCEYVCETWCAAAGLLVSVLTVTHLKTWLNDGIYELLHIEIAEQRRNKAPSLLRLSLFIVCTFRFQMAIKNRHELERCRACPPQHSSCTHSSDLWTERWVSSEVQDLVLCSLEEWPLKPPLSSSSQKFWFSVGLPVNGCSQCCESVTALACRKKTNISTCCFSINHAHSRVLTNHAIVLHYQTNTKFCSDEAASRIESAAFVCFIWMFWGFF